jgi:hypothetical protein
VSEIAKGILGGGWSLIAGWILPTAINVLVFAFFVLPNLHGIQLTSELSRSSVGDRALAALVASVVIGLVLSAVQQQLYRVLEGYFLWPQCLARLSGTRQLHRKQTLSDRLALIRLRRLEAEGRLVAEEDRERLWTLSGDSKIRKAAQKDQQRTTIQRGVLRERQRRYPVSDDQIAPTRLGNAIRRVEEYGYQRYRLDSQALWYELTAAAPRQLRRQVDNARAGVDFFVCLLYGNLLVAVVALISLSARGSNSLALVVTAGVAIAVTPLWYRLAVVATDDWALATRALVDVGRTSLADAVGLQIPKELTKEREMWDEYCKFVRSPYKDGRSTKLEEFRGIITPVHREQQVGPDEPETFRGRG